ncbi:MAG: GNAT family N-acetyltransferase [Lactobacillales bacterium]|jgi:ribosomal protein S18 acetylase RimI-like enzyme|nr:GNAT family N-acetyltransferase [Lactobacillales bacterium]
MLEIRKGQEKDKENLAQLVMIILRQMELSLVAELGEETVVDLLEQAILQDGYRYSYKRALVATVEGKVAGVAFGYTNEEESTIDVVFQQLLKEKTGLDQKLFTDSEVLGEEWYLDSIAVYDSFRGHGAGSKLLSALPEVAKESGKKVVGLNVDLENPKAQKLYEKTGFVTVGEMEIAGHKYHHMYWKV